MEGTQLRTAVRARRGVAVLDLVADGLLGADVPRVPGLWGARGASGGDAAAVTDGRVRDVGAERDLIKTVVHRVHQRRARRRLVANRRS